MEVRYFQAYIDGVDFVFIDSPMFRHLEKNIYGGKREVSFTLFLLTSKTSYKIIFLLNCYSDTCGQSVSYAFYVFPCRIY